ncbi:MAG: DUF799 family lipoprotein [Candidatus Cloacimonas sp.]|jgi:hypothetical protein|nr:DUF799 family lipoprotein [Candidatus Cloacimonas sp.]
MNRILLFSFALLTLMLLTACAPQVLMMQDAYPKMYQNPPVSILILPPINKSTAADAKEYFACSLAEALGQKGYYVMPVEAVFSVLRDEGMYDTENVNPTVLANMKKNFGADAVLFTTIEQWEKSWALTSGSLTITATFALLNTANADTLWDFSATTRVSLQSDEENIFAQLIESAIKTVVEDYFSNCLKANMMTMDQSMPYGKHHPEFGKDGETSIPLEKHREFEIQK